MHRDTKLTEKGDWEAWRTYCAAKKCDPAVQERLNVFARTRYHQYWTALTKGRGGHPELHFAWHRLEVFSQVHEGRAGKKYKDWLFMRADRSAHVLDALEGGASVLIRDAVREDLRRETSPAMMTSLHGPVAGQGANYGTDVCRLEDVLCGDVNPIDIVAQREWERIATERAEPICGTLSHREKVALLAREANLPFTHPVVEKAAKCRKSSLTNAYHDLLTRISDAVRADFPEERIDAQLHLVVQMLAVLKNRIFLSKSLEIKHARFFRLVRERMGPGILATIEGDLT